MQLDDTVDKKKAMSNEKKKKKITAKLDLFRKKATKTKNHEPFYFVMLICLRPAIQNLAPLLMRWAFCSRWKIHEEYKYAQYNANAIVFRLVKNTEIAVAFTVESAHLVVFAMKKKV